MTTHLSRPLGSVCGLQFSILRLRPCSTLAEMTGFPLLFFADPDDFGPCDWLIGLPFFVRSFSWRQDCLSALQLARGRGHACVPVTFQVSVAFLLLLPS